MTNSSDICVACGLCCDGQLFDHGRMHPGEQPLCASLGMGTEEPADDFPRFLLPCPRHSKETGCTVYDRRPITCRNFRCRLLKKHDAQRVSDEEALAIIGNVKALDWHQTLRPALLELAPEANGTVGRHLALAQEAIAASPDPADLRRRFGLVLMRTAALSNLLNSHFYPPDKAATAATTDSVPVDG
jgi:uncharacterized protein